MKMSASRLAGGIALALALLLATPTASAGNGKNALANLPKDTAMVFAMNVDRVKKSPLFQDVVKLAKNNPDFAKGIDLLKAEASFDMTRDVKTVVLGAAADFEQSKKGVLLMEGKFNAKKFVSFAKKNAKSINIGKHRKVAYYTLDGEAEVAFLGKYIAVSPKGNMPNVIDVYKGKAASIKKNKLFMAKFADTNVSKDFWTVILLPDEVKKQMAPQLGGNSIDAMMAAIDVQKGLATDIRLAAATAAGATAIVTMIKMGLGMAANAPELKAMGLANVVSNIKVKQTKANVDLSIKLTPTELTKIKTMVQALL
jgi:hypothetical protein